MQAFLHDVLGESVPPGLAEQVYFLVGGGRGVSFRELLTLLVLLTRGTREEKVKFIYGVLAVESGSHIERGEMTRACLDWDTGGALPAALPALFQVLLLLLLLFLLLLLLLILLLLILLFLLLLLPRRKLSGT